MNGTTDAELDLTPGEFINDRLSVRLRAALNQKPVVAFVAQQAVLNPRSVLMMSGDFRRDRSCPGSVPASRPVDRGGNSSGTRFGARLSSGGAAQEEPSRTLQLVGRCQGDRRRAERDASTPASQVQVRQRHGGRVTGTRAARLPGRQR